MKSLIATLLVLQAAVGSINGQDYLTRVSFALAEDRIPNYLVSVIYERPLTKNITAQSVLNLYRTDTVNLTNTRTILQRLNITESRVFSINGFNYTLELFNWTFTDFFNTITTRLNVNGLPLRNALETLGIDATAFSAGIAFGEPDPWLEFIKGNFTETNLALACNQTGITLETLWTNVRDMFAVNLASYDVLSFVRLLQNHGIAEQHALIIWNEVPVTLEHVYSLSLYNGILTNFTDRVNSQPVLGPLIGRQEVVIPRTIYDLFREDRQLLNIQATTAVTGTTLVIGVINDTIYNNLVVLRHNAQTAFENVTFIQTALSNANLTNCSYVTFQNNAVLTVGVPSALYVNQTYVIPRATIQNVVAGSSFVCNATIYGVVRGVESETIVADTFGVFVNPTPSAAQGRLNFRADLLAMLTILFVKLLN